MSNTIKQLKDVQGNAFDPQTSIEALTSTGGGVSSSQPMI